MKSSKTKQRQSEVLATQPLAESTLGEFAQHVIHEQYRHMAKQEKGVLADKDAEHLHQMRVGSRRLATALQVFDAAIDLPKAAQLKSVRKLTKVLGNLRDLDVQIQSLQEDYYPQLHAKEQKQLAEAIAILKKKRHKAFANTQTTLKEPLYQDLKAAYKHWIAEPKLTAIAQLPVKAVLPDMLSPLLSTLLLHPAWLIPTCDVTDVTVDSLHNLRKVCKYVRYQAEFFVPFYGGPFKEWISEVKVIQDRLGELQDLYVMLDLIAELFPKGEEINQLRHLAQDTKASILTNWDQTRQHYLDPKTRYQLHHLLLAPLE
ncbi:CHAD domain-containing protein [Leptolyngbya sp. AN02str]|uniref:CHAD domain-containing protein n=1 Tax=Leptolyngbya sp. AN02str TaxID=3423363 RepID=UPI003D323D63